jgi:hypothetical protein
MQKVLLFLTTLLLSFSLHAQTVAGIDIANNITLTGSAKKLVLNGAGIRTKFIFDIYIGALYLEQKQNTPAAIYQLDGEKRIHMHFLYDEISKEKLTNSWSEGFNKNHSESELAKLQSRIKQFNALFTTVKKGDVVNLDFQTNKGTTVIINDESKGIVKGADFFSALLKIWLGEHPADHDLKQAMLGQSNDR